MKIKAMNKTLVVLWTNDTIIWSLGDQKVRGKELINILKLVIKDIEETSND